tara:strand:+ start:232 stop:753 length:522 start_codon:yes stop_codon:yes gene_type:complete
MVLEFFELMSSGPKNFKAKLKRQVEFNFNESKFIYSIKFTDSLPTLILPERNYSKGELLLIGAAESIEGLCDSLYRFALGLLGKEYADAPNKDRGRKLIEYLHKSGLGGINIFDYLTIKIDEEISDLETVKKLRCDKHHGTFGRRPILNRKKPNSKTSSTLTVFNFDKTNKEN